MKKATVSFPNNLDKIDDHLPENQISPAMRAKIKDDSPSNLRQCPSCGLMSIFGMPGGRDATCQNCGFKDPCCYD